MSGRAIILLVVGIIVVSGTILYRIEAASTAIVSNSVGYQKKQTARNIAQSGVNLALVQLGYDNTWRTGFSGLNTLGGQVSVTVFDTTYAGIKSAIGIRSTATLQESTVTSTAFTYFPPPLIPPPVKGLVTLNGINNINGGIVLDAEDHDPNSLVVNPGKGSYAIWTTGSSFTIGSSSGKVGGTAAGIDFVASNPANPAVVLLNQIMLGGYPTTPDSAMGGATYGYTEGMMKSIAQSGVAGSQYVTDPAKLKSPLNGVTYVEMPAGSAVWNSATINGAGVLIVHNSAGNSLFKGANGTFSGLLIADDITLMHCQMWGAVIGLTTAPQGNVMGNGSANVYYSRKAILNAAAMLSNGSSLKVIAWKE